MTPERQKEIVEQLKLINLELKVEEDKAVCRMRMENLKILEIPFESNTELMDAILNMAFHLSKTDVLKLYEVVM